MPTYQYACTACDHAFEKFQSFSEDSLTVCPECQGRLRKVFNAVGVVFKGSGFYRTDSRAASANGSANGTEKSPAKSDSGTSDSGTSESAKSASTGDAGAASAASGSSSGSKSESKVSSAA